MYQNKLRRLTVVLNEELGVDELPSLGDIPTELTSVD